MSDPWSDLGVLYEIVGKEDDNNEIETRGQKRACENFGKIIVVEDWPINMQMIKS